MLALVQEVRVGEDREAETADEHRRGPDEEDLALGIAGVIIAFCGG
jgi:hypothetical protein